MSSTIARERIQINTSTGINTCTYAVSSAIFNVCWTLSIVLTIAAVKSKSNERNPYRMYLRGKL